MKRYKIIFKYDGSSFYGFQTQKNKRCVESEIDKVLSKINNKNTHIVACSRTDKGVHALGQVGHVDLDTDILPHKLKHALNSYLPDDIYVTEVEEVNENFHSRYDAIEKTYKYYINLAEYNPMQRNYIFQYNYKLDIEAMRNAGKYLLGEHDFRSFATDSKDKNCNRTISYFNIKEDNNILEITFTGNGFLRYQIRNMIGILIWIGQNKMEPDNMKKIIENKDRSKFGKCAPACGLYLVNIKYNNK